MKNFKHTNADSLETAVSILGKYGRKARAIAGGTDLLGEMQEAILPEYPEVIVNLKSIPGLEYIHEENDGLHIGAMTRLEDIATNGLINEKYPLLAEASCRTASPHIREMGTISGNICQSNRCWYYWMADNRFDCLRKGGKTCFAVNGDARYHSIFGSTRTGRTPCSSECPANVDIPDYMACIRNNDIAGAAQILLQANPLPAVTGRVCPHYCESGCNRTGYDEPVSIRSMERFIGDYILEHPDVVEKPAAASGKKTAIIGAGPAGLAAAFYLNRLGHEVTIYEKMEKPGGMLAYGIPPYRLPSDIVEKQVKFLSNLGIRMELNAGNIDAEALGRQYNAVLLACGAWKERHAGIRGEQFILSGMDFLRKSNTGNREVPGKSVAVIGGGNAAIDIARTLLRLGVQPSIIYRRRRKEMPALEEELEKAEQEGVRFLYLTQPVETRQHDSGILLTCTKMKPGLTDDSGRARPEPLPGSDFTMVFDAVMAALGEERDLTIIPEKYLGEMAHLETEIGFGHLGDNMFAAGDFVRGPSTVVKSVSAGRRAAEKINEYLSGSSKEDDIKTGWIKPDAFNSEYLGKNLRNTVPETPLEQRIKDIDIEDTGGLEASGAAAEANRCFNCGCVAVNPSDLAPALIASGAEIRTTRRIIAAGNFFTVAGEKTTVLDDDEIVKEIVIPALPAGAKCKFIKSAIRKSIDFPLVNCAAVIESRGGIVGSARICLNSVYTQPYRVTKAEQYLAGKSIDETTAEAAAGTILADALPLLNNRYKIQIARTLIKRVILACK